MKIKIKGTLLVLIAILIWIGQATFTLSFPNGTSYSDPYTLTPNVAYTMNITFPTNDISAGSTVDIQFGYRYSITAGSLSGCQFGIGGGAYQAGTCSVQQFGSGTSTSYIITYSNIYTSAALSQSSLNLKVTNMIFSLPSLILGEEVREQLRTFWFISMMHQVLFWEQDNLQYNFGHRL